MWYACKWRTEVGRIILYYSSTLFIKTMFLSQNHRLPIQLIPITSFIWGSPISAFQDFNYRQTCMSMWYLYRFLGYELKFYVCRVSAGTVELSLQPGGILCSNQIVTLAMINLISKDSCIPPLTLQNLLYSLEADIKCCCLVLPPCWKLQTQTCL